MTSPQTTMPAVPLRAPPSSPATDVESMYRAEVDAVWRFVSRLGVSEADIEDQVHEVFFTAFRKWAQYDQTRPARPWLFGIAYGIVSDFRALKRHKTEVAPPEMPEPAVEPPPVLELRDANRFLDQALARMTDPVRAVFVMHELEERAVPEIAELMGTPVPTAYTRLRTGRQVFADFVARLSEVKP